MSQQFSATIPTLNAMLRGEMSAVETYDQALALLTAPSEAHDDLKECRASHQERVLRLRAEILERGGEPASASGPWGYFARLIAATATVAGPRMAVSAIEAGENHGLKEYRELLQRLDMPARSIVAADIYPQQVRTHSIVSALKSEMVSPPAPAG